MSAEDAALLERADKLKVQDLLASDLCGAVSTSQKGSTPSQDNRKRRRLTAKLSCGTEVTRAVAYKYNHDWRSRRYSGGAAAQGMDRRIQKHVLGNTVDIDIVNCMLQVLHQAVQRVDIIDKETWKVELQTLHDLATDRTRICLDELSLQASAGKETILRIVNGGSIPENLRSNEYAHRISKLARWLRWLSVTLFPDMFQALKTSTNKMWPEAPLHRNHITNIRS